MSSGADPALAFSVTGVDAAERTVVPTLRCTVAVTAATPVHALVLHTRVVIDARRRRYTPDEEAGLREVFGPRESWIRTLGPITWVEVSTTVGAFAGTTTFALPIACTYDMEMASTKFFRAAMGAPIPLTFLFAGTAFVGGASGWTVVPLGRDLEAHCSMPPDVWRRLWDRTSPDARWLRLRPDTFERLARFKADRSLPTWDATLDDLLTERAAGPLAGR